MAEGCWAASYRAVESPELEYDVLARVLREARDEMGIHFFVVTGGEPFVRADAWRLYEEFSGCQFLVYTNATMVDERAVDRLAGLGNCMLMMSVEGSEESTDARRGRGVHAKVMRAMDLCRERGVLFGFSATPTRHNWEGICSDEFVSRMVEKGCSYGWFFQYIPVGRDPDAWHRLGKKRIWHKKGQSLRIRARRHRTIAIAARPFMRLAFEQEKPKLQGMWANSVN